MTPNLSTRSRLYAWLLGVPVFVKVMGIALGMAVVLGAGMLWQIHRTWHAHLLRELDLRGQRLANQLAARCAQPTRSGLAADIASELQHTLSESPDAVHLMLQHTNGAVLAEARAPVDSTRVGPIREQTALVGAGPHRMRVGMSAARVDEEVRWLTRQLARTTAAIALLGMIAAWWLTRIFAQPIEELVTLTRAVKAGQYQARAPVRANDEVGELATAFNEMASTLAQKEEARQQLLRQVIRAGEEERKRVARELHDHTGQSLTSQIASLSALENQSADPICRQRLAEIRQHVEQTLAEVHDLSVNLRPSVLDDIGLMAALDRHCRLFARRSGIHVVCQDVGLDGDRLPAEVELTIYRVVQEALTNAVRHGRASRVSVLVERKPACLRATIQDDGAGFAARDWRKRCVEQSRLGLLGIEERVLLLGGTFCIESKPGNGAAVYADIPLRDQP